MKKIAIIIVCFVFLCEGVVYSEDALRVPISQSTTKDRASKILSWPESSKLSDQKILLPTITKEQIPRILDRMKIHYNLGKEYIKIFEEFIDIVTLLKKAGINYAFNDELKILSLYAQAEIDGMEGKMTGEDIYEVLYTNSGSTLSRLRKRIRKKELIPFLKDRRGYSGIKFPEIEEKEFYELLKFLGFKDSEEILTSFIAHIKLMKRIGIDRGRTIYEDTISTFINLAKEKKKEMGYKELAEESNFNRHNVLIVPNRLRDRLKGNYIDIFSASEEEDEAFSEAFLKIKREIEYILIYVQELIDETKEKHLNLSVSSEEGHKVLLPDITREDVPHVLSCMKIKESLIGIYREIFEEFVDTVNALKSVGIQYAFNNKLKIMSVYAQMSEKGDILQYDIGSELNVDVRGILSSLAGKKRGFMKSYLFLTDRREYLGKSFPEIEEKEFYELLKFLGFKNKREILASFITHIKLMKRIGIDRGRTIYEDMISAFINLAKEKKREITYDEVAKELNISYSDVGVELSKLRAKLAKNYIDIFSASEEEDEVFSRAFLETKRDFYKTLAVFIRETSGEDLIGRGNNIASEFITADRKPESKKPPSNFIKDRSSPVSNKPALTENVYDVRKYANGKLEPVTQKEWFTSTPNTKTIYIRVAYRKYVKAGKLYYRVKEDDNNVITELVYKDNDEEKVLSKYRYIEYFKPFRGRSTYYGGWYCYWFKPESKLTSKFMKDILRFSQYWEMRAFLTDPKKAVLRKFRRGALLIERCSRFIEDMGRQDKLDELRNIKDPSGPRIYIDDAGNRRVNASRITVEEIASSLGTDIEALPWLFMAMNEKHRNYAPCYLPAEHFGAAQIPMSGILKEAFRSLKTLRSSN